MQLRDALEQVHEIRRMVGRAAVYRGIRSWAALTSAGFASLGAGLQALLIRDPAANLYAYLGIWVSVAACSIAVSVWAMLCRVRAGQSQIEREQLLEVIERLSPVVGVGAWLAVVLGIWAPQAVWILPGMWSILFGLGMLSMRRMLPRLVMLVGFFYLASGLTCLAWAQGANALSPWAMVSTFGIGQVLAASVLYWTLDRPAAINP